MNSSLAYSAGFGLSVEFKTMLQSRVVLSSDGPKDNRLVESTLTTIVRPSESKYARAGVSGKSIGVPFRSQWLSNVFHKVKGWDVISTLIESDSKIVFERRARKRI